MQTQYAYSQLHIYVFPSTTVEVFYATFVADMKTYLINKQIIFNVAQLITYKLSYGVHD